MVEGGGEKSGEEMEKKKSRKTGKLHKKKNVYKETRAQDVTHWKDYDFYSRATVPTAPAI